MYVNNIYKFTEYTKKHSVPRFFLSLCGIHSFVSFFVIRTDTQFSELVVVNVTVVVIVVFVVGSCDINNATHANVKPSNNNDNNNTQTSKATTFSRCSLQNAKEKKLKLKQKQRETTKILVAHFQVHCQGRPLLTCACPYRRLLPGYNYYCASIFLYL